LKVRFEDLVGGKGGGSNDLQIEQVRRLQAHLGISGSAEAIAAEAFDSATRTFSKGRAHRWKEEFSAANIAAFEEKYGQLVRAFGYQ
jgi:hypothetical protein